MRVLASGSFDHSIRLWAEMTPSKNGLLGVALPGRAVVRWMMAIAIGPLVLYCVCGDALIEMLGYATS